MIDNQTPGITHARTNRLSKGANELINRDKVVTFTFNGKTIHAFEGDTIASALLASGIKLVARSFKYHRPRGLMAHGHSMNSMVQIGNEVSVSAWLRHVEDGLDVKTVNAWPSPKFDIMSATSLGDRFMPVGFYYKTFIKPAALWPTYEHVLRHAAGLGKLDINTPLEGGFDKQYLHADVAVVGAGPAGISAAIRAAQAGVRVLLLEEDSTIGGHLRFTGGNRKRLQQLTSKLAEFENVTVLTDTLVFSWFEDNWLGAVCGKRMYKIRAATCIMATGATDQPLVFGDNDRPGIMMGSAVARLLHLHGVAAGINPLIVTANDDGWRLAADLLQAGVKPAGVADMRSSSDSPLVDFVSESGVPIYWQHTVQQAHGAHKVRAATLVEIDKNGALGKKRQRVNADLIAVAIGWAPDNGLLYQAGTKLGYDETRHEFVATAMSNGVFAAGRVLGTHDVATQMAEGRLAAQRALATITNTSPPTDAAIAEVEAAKAAEPVRTSDLVFVAGPGKHFVDLDEDVTDKDTTTAIAEGYNSVELLKRYSTISMGPSQGRWSSINAMHLTARANGATIAETGTTTSRPPVRPIRLGNLGGQLMEPVKYTPIHDWHLANGGQMMVSGLWMRAEHYGDPIAEVKAVRERVGLIDVSTLGKFKLTGHGVADFLDKVYINRWQKLKPNRVRYGIMCNSEGVITDDGVTARISEDEWYMTTTSAGATSVFEWLQWWMQSGWGDGVHLTSVSEGRAGFNLAGPLSRQVLAKLTSADLSDEAIPYMGLADIDVAGVPCRILRIGFTGELSFEIHCPASLAQHVWNEIMAAGEDVGILPFGVEAQRILRLEKAHIIVGQDTDALTDPISANQAWAVKLGKNDFLGQRPIARVVERGVEQKLVGFKTVEPTAVPEEGLQIVERQANGDLEIIGWITSCRHSPTLNETIGMCWLRPDIASQEGATFYIRRNEAFEEARVHHGAFYDPSGSLLRK